MVQLRARPACFDYKTGGCIQSLVFHHFDDTKYEIRKSRRFYAATIIIHHQRAQTWLRCVCSDDALWVENTSSPARLAAAKLHEGLNVISVPCMQQVITSINIIAYSTSIMERNMLCNMLSIIPHSRYVTPLIK